ncbi:MAG: hypothetical protein JRJ12_07200 [Deltaproteobacteria bacterium]|nr:hypothetical protein [Deltaproteobacteria bacterium]MBW2072050.1 hypothetical protein [Deltaproteobacteria bacterium]
MTGQEDMDRFQCEECKEFFYFDLAFEGMSAEPGELVPLACPLCQHAWSRYLPDEWEHENTLH